MGFTSNAVVLGEEVAWFQQLGRVVAELQHQVLSSVTQSVRVRPNEPGDSDDNRHDGPALSQECSTAFDCADLLEGGVSPGISVDHIVPPKLGTEVRLRVLEAQDRKQYVLSEENGSTRLVARCEKQGRFEIFVSQHGDPPLALGPAFTLTANDPALTNWTLVSLRCEECEARGKRTRGVRELGRFTHYCEQVGNGTALCMDLETPAIGEDDHADVWCTRCSEPGVQDRYAELTSIRPKWSTKRKDLHLNFKGRCKLTSSRNFLLESSDKPGVAKLLFGRCADREFVLDYASPLSEVQAFAAALTTSHWI